MCSTNKQAKVNDKKQRRVEYCVYLRRRHLSITKLLNHKLAPVAVDYPFPPGGPLAEYKMFPTPKFARTFPYQVRLATSTTVTAPSFIIPPSPHRPFTSLCKSSSTAFGSQIPPHNPPSPNHRFLFESTLLLSERYYLFYRINEVKLLYEFVCDVSFLVQEPL